MRGQTELLELLLAEAIKWQIIKRERLRLRPTDVWGICELLEQMGPIDPSPEKPRIITYDEFELLSDLIYDNKPKSYNGGYYFKPGNWDVRVEYIQGLLKQSKKADLLKERSADGL